MSANIRLAGEIEQGKPIFSSVDIVTIQSELIDTGELVYRVRDAPEYHAGDLLVVQLRKKVFTGESVLATKGSCAFLGHFWGKHRLRELRVPSGMRFQRITGNLEIIGAVTVVIHELIA